MPRSRIGTALLAAFASIGLAGCATDGFYGGDSYYSAGYGAYNAVPSYGWYDNYYYPGNGYYVYDRGGRRSSWNGDQRRYWQGRAVNRGDRREIRQNTRDYRAERRDDRAGFREQRQANREALRSGRITRDQFRAERLDNRRAFQRDQRQDQRALRRENRRALRN